MPIYEYLCRDCDRRTEVYFRSRRTAKPPLCGHCGGKRTRRALSRFATPLTEQQVRERHGTPAPGAGPDAYRDPRQIGRWAEERIAELGVDMPAEARTMIDAARDGELPQPLKDL